MQKDQKSLIESEISSLQEIKKENLQYTNKTAYIKEKVFEYKKKWWDKWEQMMDSDDKNESRAALIEYNKLQCRILPTEITGADGEQLILNVVGYGLKNKMIEEEETSDGKTVITLDK